MLPRCRSLWSPPDYSNNPAFVARILDPTFRSWGSSINSLWNLLGRSVDPDVALNPQRHTLLPLRTPHMIVPGGRFCEFYYVRRALREHYMCRGGSKVCVDAL
jgi:hypothetical protein